MAPKRKVTDAAPDPTTEPSVRAKRRKTSPSDTTHSAPQPGPSSRPAAAVDSRSMGKTQKAVLVEATANPLPHKRGKARTREDPQSMNAVASSSAHAPLDGAAQMHFQNDERASVAASMLEENEDSCSSTRSSLSPTRALASEDIVERVLQLSPHSLSSSSPLPVPVEDDRAGVLSLDIWSEISRYLPIKDLGNVSLVCRTLEYYFRPYLYRAILHPGEGQIPQAVAHALFVHLIRRPDLAWHVRIFNGDDIDMPVPSDGLFFRALSSMLNLDVLVIGPGLLDHRFTMTLPTLRMLKVNLPVPREFIKRHTHLEALDIYYQHDGLAVDLGPGDDLKFLSCSYDVACDVLKNKTSRHLAEDALLQVLVPRMSVPDALPVDFLKALMKTHHLPGMVDMDRFVLRHLAASARLQSPHRNNVRHLRIHIDATGDASMTNSGLCRYLQYVRQVLKAFVGVRVLELRDYTLVRNDGDGEVDTWLMPDLCNEFRRRCHDLTTVVAPSGRTLIFDSVERTWVDSVEPKLRVNPFHAKLETPLWSR